MEKYCTDCGKVFDDLKYKLCPYCGGKLDTRYGRQPIPRKLRHKVFQRDGYRCRECGASKEETSLEIDHIVPVARGGTNDIDNLQTLCRECNRMKHTDEWVGGVNTVEVAENELNNLKNQINDLEENLKCATDKNDILDYKFKIKKLNKLIPEAQKKLNYLRHEAKINEKRLQDNQIKEVLFKELYVEFDDEILKNVFDYFNLDESSDEENLRLLVDKYSREIIFKTIDLVQIFESKGIPDNIYNLGNNDVLIILKDGTNLTNWNEVVNKEDIIFIIEDLSNFTDLSNRYQNLTSLLAIKTLGTTDQVTDMHSMFEGCGSLIDVSGLSGWDVSNVTSMSSMFRGCGSLVDVGGLSGWDVSNVTDMMFMFRGCGSLVDVGGLSGWDVSNVTSMSSMFGGCGSLVDVGGLSGWDVSNVTSMLSMFWGCGSLVDVGGLSGWDVSNVTSMLSMFRGCGSLVDVSVLSGWDVSNVTEMWSMFRGCGSLVDVSVLSGWDVSNVTAMWSMFEDCGSLVDVSVLSGWDVSSVTNMGDMFRGCGSLVDVSGLSGWDVSNLTNMDRMFCSCGSLRENTIPKHFGNTLFRS